MTRKREDLTQDELKQQLYYEPDTGIFTRLRSFNQIKKGDIAGSIRNDGYTEISVLGFRYLTHRLAWLYINSKFPFNLIDHINGNKIDNRICNLRDVTNQENTQNIRKPYSNNTSGYLGVCKRKSGNKFESHIKINSVKMYLGSFDTAELAHQAYLEAKRRLHSTCTI